MTKKEKEDYLISKYEILFIQSDSDDFLTSDKNKIKMEQIINYLIKKEREEKILHLLK